MAVDWVVVATLAAPILALFVGVWINRRFENRPILISHFGHVAAFRHQPQNGQIIHVHTHTVVLRNAGRRSATNVRVHHATLPEFNIWPQLQHSVETLPDGSRDIVIPTLVPGEQVTISYLYFAPLTAAHVNAGIKSDQGFAKEVRVLIQRQYPLWFNLTVALLMLIGLVTIVYAIYKMLRPLVLGAA